MTSPFLLRLTNTLAYFFFLGSDIYAVAGPDGVSDAYARHPTYLTPAPWAFAIWGIIHFLFFGFIVWQVCLFCDVCKDMGFFFDGSPAYFCVMEFSQR